MTWGMSHVSGLRNSGCMKNELAGEAEESSSGHIELMGDVALEGNQMMLPPNRTLGHKNYLELRASKKPQTQ